MNQAVAVVESGSDPELLSAVDSTEPEPFRIGVPLLLAAGWGALFAFSAAFMADEARVDKAAASTERTAVIEPANYAGVADPVRPIGAAPPGPRWRETEAEAPAPDAKKEPAAIRTVAAPALVPPASTARLEGASTERAAFIGTWGPNAMACGARSRRRGYLPATITEDGAKAGRVLCRFKNGRRDGVAWTTTADCSDRGRRWTSQVRLVVDGDRLTWTSGKGPAFYVRCGRKDG